ncbi:hypothetical protein RJG79_00655 [Mycoplasmatota bacterium WC44]
MFLILLPVVLLVLTFLMKLSINRNWKLPQFILSLLELPVDIMFLSSSLLISYYILLAEKNASLVVTDNSKSMIDLRIFNDINKGLLFFLISLCISFIVVIIWRKSEEIFEEELDGWKKLFRINVGISIVILVSTIFILSEVI